MDNEPSLILDKSACDFCFTLKTTTSSKSRPKKRGATAQEDPADNVMSHGFIHLLEGRESNECLRARYRAFKNSWDLMEAKARRLLEEAHETLIQKIDEFVRETLEEEQKKKAYGSPYNEITTSLIQMGINMSDHDIIFKKMMQELKKNPHNRVALLRAKECPDSVSMIRLAVSQWLDETPYDVDAIIDSEHEISDDDQLKDSYETHRYRSTKRKFLDMQTLLQYVKSTSSMEKLQFVALIQDVECFLPMILEDFIKICSEYRLECSLTFVFGLATSIEIFRNSLSKSALCLLRTRGFQLDHPLTILDSLIDSLLIGDKFDNECGVDFMLGWKAYKFLVDAVMLHHFSLEFFVKGLKYALLQHYQTNPLSFLNQRDTLNASPSDQIDLLSSEHLGLIRQLPSFRKWIVFLSERKDILESLLQDDDYLRSYIPDFLKFLRIYLRNYRLALDLFILIQTLTKSPNKSKRMLYLYGLEKHFFETNHYKEVMKRLGFVDEAVLSKLLNHILDLISFNTSPVATVKFSYFSDSFIQSLKGIQDSLRWIKSDTQDPSTADPLTSVHSIIQELKLLLDQHFQAHLVCYRWVPFHEVILFNESLTLEQALHPRLLTSIHSALSQPWNVLKCNCCSESSSSQSFLPDTCIVYGLYHEFGRMINLFDWYTTFSSLIKQSNDTVSSSYKKRRKSTKTELESTDKVDFSLLSRFIRSVSELQVIGLIKPTRRKPDHVLRLSWTSCHT